MYDRILLPTDGSEGAEKAVEHALSLAEKYDAEILFLNVVDVRAQNTMDMWADVLGHMEESGKELTRDMVDRADENGVEADAEVVRGVPSREIVSRTEDDVDLVVMGTHGRTGLDRILVGSVAEKVVRTSEVPVMTVGRKG
jgi:nucleotide-binding universal stress UspA family protein